jgi:hypothetical protein
MYEDLDDQCFGNRGLHPGENEIPECVSTFYHLLSGLGQEGFETPDEIEEQYYLDHGWVDDDTDEMDDLQDDLHEDLPWRLMNNVVDWDELPINSVRGASGMYLNIWNNRRDEYHVKFITSYLDKKYRRTSHSTRLWESPWHGANCITGLD